MNFRPLGNRILVKPEQQTASTSLIVIPDSVKSDATRGVVIAAGLGKREKGKLVPTKVQVGDTVLFPRGSGSPVELDKQKYIVMFDQDIVGIV